MSSPSSPRSRGVALLGSTGSIGRQVVDVLVAHPEAFHTVALAMVDLDFAKQQLDLMLRELYLNPNGQIPAYEWNFGDVNPPVHAWATMFVYTLEKQRRGQGGHQIS